MYRKTRRRLTVGTIIWAAVVIMWILIKGNPESALHNTALEYSFVLIFGTLSAYGVMAGWDKKVEKDASSNRPGS